LSGHSIILAVEMLWLDSFFRALSEVVSRFVPKSDLFCVFLGCGLDLFERGASISCYRLVSSLVNHSEPRLAAAASRVEEPAPRFSRSRLSHEAQAVKGFVRQPGAHKQRESMSQPPDNASPSTGGRYRFCGGRFVDPNEGVHPEMADLDGAPLASGIPNSPDELIAMQDDQAKLPEKPERNQSAKVKQVLDLMERLETSSSEDQQIAVAIVRHLERFHDGVVEEMKEDAEAKHSQIAAWAIDADRLMHCRIFLESIDL